MEFVQGETSDGRAVIKSFSIQNTGRNVRSLRLTRPISEVFRISNPNKIPFDLAAGLRCTVKVQLIPPIDGHVRLDPIRQKYDRY